MNFYFEGLLLQASLILALGAQNIFVLESALHKRRPFIAATICTLCDALLIFIGVLGVGRIFAQAPFLKVGFGILGIAFLFFYGAGKIKACLLSDPGLAKNPTDNLTLSPKSTFSRGRVALLALAFSLLNPHVYLDTLVLIGGYSAQIPAAKARLSFAAGAASFSALWFFGLAFFASALSQFICSPRAMRSISFVAGVILIVLSLKLSFDVASWALTPSLP